MRVLVTGSRGFIGSRLVKELTILGDDVVRLYHEDFDPTSTALQKKISGHFDNIYHLGAYGNMSNQKGDIKMFNANVSHTMRLLEMTKDIDYASFVFVSTSSVNLPRQTMYSSTKLAAEKLCKGFVDEYDKPIIIVRPYSVYGEGEADFRFIPTLFRSCMKQEPMELDPDATHDWIYVGDVVKHLITISGDPEAYVYDDPVELGTGIATENADVVRSVGAITGRSPNITGFKKIRRYDNKDWKSPTKLNGISIEEGLKKYYESVK